jgi:Methyltransferase domain
MEIKVPLLSFNETIPQIPGNAMQDAKLYPSRHDMLKALPRNQCVIEVGVAYGDFSEVIVKELRPKSFIGVDHFGLEKFPLVWGVNPKETLGNLTHENFYQTRMERLSEEFNFEYIHKAGKSAKMISDCESFDFAYIDAGHEYEDVERDTRAVIQKLAPGGHIFFNDYIWRDTFHGGLYGVVKTVNQLVSEGGWIVKGLALNPMMFCDIWVQKI